MNIRKNIFWLTDFINGGHIKNHLNDITEIQENENTSQQIRDKHLNRLVKHAIATTPFYKGYGNFKNFQEFPIIDKNIIRNNFDSFTSKSYLNQPKITVSTSGSTGVPFRLYQDKNKKQRKTADLIYFSKKAGYTIGHKLYYLESWRHLGNNLLKSFIKNLQYVDITRFNRIEIQTLINKLERTAKPQNIIGLPSAFEEMCNYLDEINYNKPKTCKITSIVSVSEFLDDDLKKSLERYFNTNVVSRYSNEEMGVLAQQNRFNEDETFEINWASYYVEILKIGSDEPVGKGELGRIIITDLFNYCMPIIRYDTGDIGAFEEKSTSSGLLKLKTIEGRKMDMLYDTEGNFISPHLINTIFYKYGKHFKQFQFIQNAKNEYTVKLNTKKPFLEENKLICDIKIDFGDDAIINVIYVDEIPTLASGKRRKVVNNYTKTD